MSGLIVQWIASSLIVQQIVNGLIAQWIVSSSIVQWIVSGLRGDTGCKIDQIVFLGENEIGADFDTLTSLVTVQ